jgi:hypothetical protein
MWLQSYYIILNYPNSEIFLRMNAKNDFGLSKGGDFHHPVSFRDGCGEPNFEYPQMCLRSTEPPLLPPRSSSEAKPVLCPVLLS